ncbi:MAG: 50S ribosomal protein L22 [Verrucomicrobiota bacterium]
MEVKSIYKNARISAFKCREVTREIQGLPVMEALDVVKFCPKKAARLVGKTLKSAVANAENNNSLRLQNLVVKEAVVGEGRTMKRFRPKARGSAGRILKRSSHIRIVLTEDETLAQPKKKSSPKKAAKPAASKAKKETEPKKPAKADKKTEAKAEKKAEPKTETKPDATPDSKE